MPLQRELIYINGKDETGRVVSYSYQAKKCVIAFRNSDKPYLYNADKVKIVKTAISEDEAFNIFSYLEKIADTVGLKTEEGANILARSYQRISFIAKDCILANYLNGKMPPENSNHQPVEVFPFGFNISQKNAVNTAFSWPLSVIEGPPGTGKTQTILNIIANAVMNGKSVAVVSSNNSATKNAYEKLEKSGIGFIAALLGNSQNRKEFIESQTDVPDLSNYKLSEEERTRIEENTQKLFHRLLGYLSKKNELALLNQELDNIKTEHQHFLNTYQGQTEETVKYFKPRITSNALLALWVSIENQARKGKKFGLIKRFVFRIKYGIKDRLFYTYSFEKMIHICQSRYYPTKISELEKRARVLENSLTKFSFSSKMKEYTNLSMQLLKAELNVRYNRRKEKHIQSVNSAPIHPNSSKIIL
ncbi:AAA domain-containing protein [Albibacterium indicum]|uniref:AAA domain-containing protein n=1 Tax=Albibacterium indicum TaxID=2292082 RepID=UPI000E48DAA2|nr:AAA domain-containing protein [Pedobacter indicus]